MKKILLTTRFGHTAEIIDNKLVVTCCHCDRKFKKILSPKELTNVVVFHENFGIHPDGPVQDIFPHWTRSDRELFLMTHICWSCWDSLFGVEEEDT